MLSRFKKPKLNEDEVARCIAVINVWKAELDDDELKGIYDDLTDKLNKMYKELSK